MVGPESGFDMVEGAVPVESANLMGESGFQVLSPAGFDELWPKMDGVLVPVLAGPEVKRPPLGVLFDDLKRLDDGLLSTESPWPGAAVLGEPNGFGVDVPGVVMEEESLDEGLKREEKGFFGSSSVCRFG